MTSKDIVLKYFPKAVCRSYEAYSSDGTEETETYYHIASLDNSVSIFNPFPFIKDELKAWDVCVKHPKMRDRYIEILSGRFSTQLQEFHADVENAMNMYETAEKIWNVIESSKEFIAAENEPEIETESSLSRNW